MTDAADYISAMLSADENETFAFAITTDGQVVGSIGIFRQGNIHRQTVELGYYIAEDYWGKGIMASCRVLEKAGFQYEGTLRNNAVKEMTI